MGTQQENGTKARLLHAGRKIFAENGLENATVRDICSQAGANVAAVNYHFGGKERLYVAVLQDYIERENEQHPRDAGVGPGSAPKDRLRAYLRSFLLQTLGDGSPENERLGKLLTQEFIEPSQYFGEIFEKHCRPTQNMLLDIVRQMLPGVDEISISRCASSIIGQCVLFDVAKEAISRMNPELTLKAGNIENIVDFILDFSLGGIQSIKDRLERPDQA